MEDDLTWLLTKKTQHAKVLVPLLKTVNAYSRTANATLIRAVPANAY